MITKSKLLFALLVGATSSVLAADIEGNNYIPYENVKGGNVGFCNGTKEREVVDTWSFYTCNCTSFVAYWLNNKTFIEMKDGRKVPLFMFHPFNNGYFFSDLTADQKSKLPTLASGDNAKWGDAQRWGGLAHVFGIPAFDNPQTDTIAWWNVNAIGGGHGHVAVYQGVTNDSNGKLGNLYWNYNINQFLFSENWVYDDGNGNTISNPSGYIDFVSFEKSRVVISPRNHPELFQSDALCQKISPDSRVEQFRTKEGFLFPTMSLSDTGSDTSIFYYGSMCSVQSSAPLKTLLAQNDSHILIGGYGGGSTEATDPRIPSRPDFVVNYLKLYQGDTETYQYHATDRITIRTQFANIGSANPSKDIPLRYYLSIGSKEDPHSGNGAWRRVTRNKNNKPDGNIKKANLKKGKIKNESIDVDLAPFFLSAGIYNIVGCADRTKDDHNGDGAIPEEHASNNCSTEAVFEIVSDTPIDPVTPPTPIIDFTVSNFQMLQVPVYAGDPARFGGTVSNIGNTASPSGIRSTYYAECPGTGRVPLTDDGTEAEKLTAGGGDWEENKSPVGMPAVAGTCTISLCANDPVSVTESDMNNNCASLQVTLQEKPYNVDFTVTDFQILQAPTQAGDPIRLGGWVKNIGNTNSPAEIRSTYYAECSGTGRIPLTSDGSDVGNLTAGNGEWEEMIHAELMPNVAGTCTVSFCANEPSYVTDSNLSNNCQSFQVTMQEKQVPHVYIQPGSAKYTHKDGRVDGIVHSGTSTHPQVVICNDGNGYPTGITTVRYTGLDEDDHIKIEELPPGGCIVERIDGDGYYVSKSYRGAISIDICIVETGECATASAWVEKK